MKTKLLQCTLGATLLVACMTSLSAELTPIELLGKNIFFDPISIPANKQACVSCHEPSRGGILPDSNVNNSTVVAPGAAPHALGSIKPPNNAYATFAPPFSEIAPGAGVWRGGNFWDGRAEGCGATGGSCPTTPTPIESPKNVSETISVNDIPLAKQSEYSKYLGPTADQALNPFPNTVEQNTREKKVCQQVKTASYKALYDQAFGQSIDCSPDPSLPVEQRAYHKSYKLIALSIAAWQASTDLNSFSSKRDKALQRELAGIDVDSTPGKFPLVGLTDQENLGHDLFFSTAVNSTDSTGPRGAGCVRCHNSAAAGSDGSEPNQLYTDFRYRNIGMPFNAQIPGVAFQEKIGLAAHVTTVNPGTFKTPSLRGVGKGVDGTFVKAFFHNGWIKSLEQAVHFYNTRDALPRCESIGINNATAAQAMASNCWPAPEFPNPVDGVAVGNLRLTPEEEAAIVAYLRTLSDESTPVKP